MNRKVVFLLRPRFSAVLAAIDSAIGGDHDGRRVCARSNAAHPGFRLRQRTSNGVPTGAEVVADHNAAARRRPDALRPRRIGLDRIDRRVCTAKTGVGPGAPPIAAYHRPAVDHSRQSVGGSRDHRQRRHLARLREPGHGRIGAAAVLAREQPAWAEQIETILRSARRRPLVPGPRSPGALARSQPSRSRRNTPFAAAQTANWPSGEKTSANTAPMMRSRASGAQLRPPLRELRIPRSVPTNR